MGVNDLVMTTYISHARKDLLPTDGSTDWQMAYVGLQQIRSRSLLTQPTSSGCFSADFTFKPKPIRMSLSRPARLFGVGQFKTARLSWEPRLRGSSRQPEVSTSWISYLQGQMTDTFMTDELAAPISGVRLAPVRHVKLGLSWMPPSRFRTLIDFGEAFSVFDSSSNNRSSIAVEDDAFTAHMRLGNGIGKATGMLDSRAISLAIAQGISEDSYQ